MKPIICFLLLTIPTVAFAQNVGIGVTNPTRAKLEVNGAAGATSAIFGGESNGISLQRNMPSIGFNQYYSTSSRYMSVGYAANFYLNPDNGSMGLDMLGSGHANTNTLAAYRAFSIGNTGNMGIRGGHSASASLVVNKAGNYDGSAIFTGTKHHSYFGYGNSENVYIRAGKDSGIVYINDIPASKIIMTGLVGINTANPSSCLEVRQTTGRGLVLVENTNNASWEFRVAVTTGNLRLYSNERWVGTYETDGSYSTVSDQRLKQDIRSLPATMQQLMQLRPVTYEMKYNNPGHKRSVGFIAQELKTIFPELVTVTKDSVTAYKDIPDLHTVNYAGLTPLLLKGMQEQQQVIQSMQDQIDALKKTVETLTSSSKARMAK